MGRDSATSLAPGFRFHPTDDELVRYYLKRKVCNKPFRFNPISDVDVYKSEPWDLPGKSNLKTRDLEWYFFSVLDKKYGNGSRTNRATERGYWKTTGKDRSIYCTSRIVGMKKTLVYHNGRAPRGERTNWVMHEYRLVDEELEKAGVQQDAFVLCRIFQKSGSGPKNGEQYGAPFIEEEWEEDEVALVPGGQDIVADEVAVSDDAFVEVNDMNQNPDINYPCEKSPIPLNFYHGESSNYGEHSREFSEDGQKPVICMQGAQCGTEPHYGQMFSNLPQQNEMDANVVKDENGLELMNNVIADEVKYCPAEPYLDADYNLVVGDDGLYLEANDLSNAVEADSLDLNVEDYLTFCDADDEFLASDPAQIESEMPVPDQELPAVEHLYGGTEQVPISSQQPLEAHSNDQASSSKQMPEATLSGKDVNYPFIKKASHMLGSFPAPPALASEFPTKEVALRLNAAAQSSSSMHVTAGIIRITNMTLSGNGSLGKNGNANIVVSFGLSEDAVTSSGILPMANRLSAKTGSMMSRIWLFLTFFWVLILPVSFKVGTHIYAKQ